MKFSSNIVITPYLLLLFIFLLDAIPGLLGSSGDLDPVYRDCLLGRQTQSLSISEEAKEYERSAEYECLSGNRDLCEYNCMQWISVCRRDRGYHVLKYYGHWPYLRVWGMQEPASAVFSLLNAIPHVVALFCGKIRRRYIRHNNYMAPWLALYPYVSINAWIASTLYHASHGHEQQHHMTLFSTSMYDYMSALAILAYSLAMVIRKMIGQENHTLKIWGIVESFILLSIALFLYQIHRMFMGFVSYDSHMRVCIFLAGSHSVMWLLWIIFATDCTMKRRMLCLICNIWFIGASLLELFDFEPLLLHFDAHSLWHAATVPLGFLWYAFWIIDVEESMLTAIPAIRDKYTPKLS